MAIPGSRLSDLVGETIERSGADPSTHIVGLDEDDRIALELWRRENDASRIARFELRYDRFAPAGAPLIRPRP